MSGTNSFACSALISAAAAASAHVAGGYRHHQRKKGSKIRDFGAKAGALLRQKSCSACSMSTTYSWLLRH
jgi:hypothetical protein